MDKPDYSAYMDRKRLSLGLDREDTLAGLQTLLEGWYPGMVRVKRLHQGVLTVITPSASVAGELRMRQVELLAAADLADTRLSVSIGTLE